MKYRARIDCPSTKMQRTKAAPPPAKGGQRERVQCLQPLRSSGADAKGASMRIPEWVLVSKVLRKVLRDATMIVQLADAGPVCVCAMHIRNESARLLKALDAAKKGST